jgi:hypothetical protein
MNSKMVFDKTYEMSGLEGRPKFWLYKIESFLFMQSCIVHIVREDKPGISTLRFRQIPTPEEVANKYIDIFIKKKL